MALAAKGSDIIYVYIYIQLYLFTHIYIYIYLFTYIYIVIPLVSESPDSRLLASDCKYFSQADADTHKRQFAENTPNRNCTCTRLLTRFPFQEYIPEFCDHLIILGLQACLTPGYLYHNLIQPI